MLEPLAASAEDAGESAEACGLLGRVYKQLYVNAVKADPQPRAGGATSAT